MIEDVHTQRKATGNICQTIHSSKYRIRPRFLRRNLREILDSHERSLHHRDADGIAGGEENMTASRKRTWGWDFPTTDMLRDYMNGDKPVLQLESLQLRRPGSRASSTRLQHGGVLDDGDGPDWLPDPRNDNVWPCTVGVAVWHVQASKKQVHFESLSAKILEIREDDHSSSFDIVLDKPFFIEVNKLFVVTESGNNGSRSWKRTTTATYTMDISIQCQYSDDSTELLGRLEGREGSDYENQPSSEAVLKATWDKLPTCPSRGQLLPLRRSKSHRALELDYKLEMTMGWMTRRDYRLKTYNIVFHSKQQEDRQLPTPSASEDLEKPTKRYDIVWTYRDSSATRTFTAPKLTCPLCRDGRDYHYFERLMLHCKNHHSHFNFDADYTVDKADASSFDATVSMTVATQSYEKQVEEEDKEMDWIAPNRPFNLRAHLRGEDDWTRQTRPRSRKGGNRHQPKERALPSSSLMLPSRKRPAPDDVEDLPANTPKRHRVPHVPDVSFYRITSKQIIQPGEYIAESDDDADESWFSQSQGRALEDLGVTGVAKDFIQAFNQHVAREQSDSSILVRDALVRFARAYKREFGDVQWQRLFRAKLNQFRSVGIIGDDVVAACVRIMQTTDGEAGSADATSSVIVDGEDHDNETSGQERQINGGSINLHRGDHDTPDGGRSTSPENGRLLHRERKKWTNGKGVVRDSNLQNGTTPPRATDSPIPGGGTTNVTSTHQANDSHGQSTNAQPPRHQTCFCGEKARQARGTIACADPRCVRKDFHMACVGLERRVNGWRCSDCSS